MARTRAGLHKEISTIFDGVPIPRSGQVKQAHHRGPPGRIGYVPAKSPDSHPAAPGPQPPAHGSAPKEAPKGDASLRPAGRTARRPSRKLSTQELFKPKAGISSVRQKVAVLLIPVLLISLIVVLVHNSGITWPNASPADATPGVAGPAVARSSVAIGWEFQPAYAGGLPDPMNRTAVSAVDPVKTGEKLVLTGIVIAKDRSYAIIDTEIVEVGQQVSDATVRRISPNEVDVEIDGKTVILRLQPEEDSE